MDIKKGDAVKIIAGKDKGKHGNVVSASPSTNKVVVEGINVVSKHLRARKADEKSGIVNKAAPIDASNAMIICPVCLQATRIERKLDEQGKKARFCKKCQANIDANGAKAKATVKKAKKASTAKKKTDKAASDAKPETEE